MSENRNMETDELPEQDSASRRGLLKLAAGAAAGGAAAAVVAASSASANDGDNVVVGQVTTQGNTARTFTTINYTNAQSPYQGIGFGSGPANVFLVRDNPGGILIINPDTSPYPAAVAGYAYRAVDNGVYGYTGKADGYGVVAYGQTGAKGLLARGKKANVEMYNEGSVPQTRTDPHARGELLCDGDGTLWYCTAAGTPGTWQKMAGSGTSGQLHPITPARVYDSRPGELPLTVPKGRLEPGMNRVVDCTVNSSGVPADATAVVINLTAAATVGRGFLGVYPDGVAAPATSTLNYNVGLNIANSTTSGCGPGAKIRVRCGGSTGAHFLVDVVAYYR